MYFLPRALSKRGLDVRIFTPKYGVTKLKIGESRRRIKLNEEVIGLPVPVNGKKEGSLICNVLSARAKKNDAKVYFLENQEYYELRENVFGYMDDHTRFALLTKGCLEWLRHQKKRIKEGEKDVWFPEVIHCHDWHTSYFIEMARKDRRYSAMLKNVPIVLTVHNFKYQGVRDFKYAREEEKDWGDKPLESIKSDKLKDQNALLRGLLYSDLVTTVSPTHAVEVMTPEYSEGLLDVLVKIRGKLSGILNGLDTNEFNPLTDPIIKQHYSVSSFSKAHAINKRDLQREFQLPKIPDVPIFGFVGRMTSQKGIELILEVMPRLLEERDDIQFIFLGGGDEKYRKELNRLKEMYPDNIGLFLYSDFRLPRKIFAGSDMILMPSIFEPGGIVALEALRFGAVPIVRATGGLSDMIEHFNPETGKGNGFSFKQKTAWSLYGVMIEAITMYKQPHLWKKLVRNAMTSVVTWDDAAEEYHDWYKRALAERKRYLKMKERGA
jgi:starch synthase